MAAAAAREIAMRNALTQIPTLSKGGEYTSWRNSVMGNIAGLETICAGIEQSFTNHLAGSAPAPLTNIAGFGEAVYRSIFIDGLTVFAFLRVGCFGP